MTKFAQVLDSAAGLAVEEQESLADVLQHRGDKRGATGE
jgi:hypothetical protein